MQYALVLALVDIALLVELAEDLLHDLLVAFVRGADEVIVLDVHQFPELLGLGNDLVYELLGCYACFGSLFFDLLAVLVRAGEEVGVVAGHALEAGHGVGSHGGVGVADVHVAAGVVDGGRDVKLFCHWGALLASVFMVRIG